jgi:hypothetical protein
VLGWDLLKGQGAGLGPAEGITFNDNSLLFFTHLSVSEKMLLGKASSQCGKHILSSSDPEFTTV